METTGELRGQGEFAGRGLKSSRDFPVTVDEPMGIHTSLWCSMVIDFSGELQNDGFNNGWYAAFGMQGSLVQIQSSRPRIKAQNQDVMLGRRHPDFRVLIPWCPNSDHEVTVPDLPTARLWKGKPAPASKVKRIKYGVPGIPYSTPPLNRYRLDLFG